MGYIYIFGCIFLTVYGQLVLKWRMNMQPPLPDDLLAKVFQLIKLIIFDPYILSGFIAAFAASIFWMAAMTKFSISFAYPFMSLAFIFVMIGSFLFFGESITVQKIVGTFVIIAGLVILAKGS